MLGVLEFLEHLILIKIASCVQHNLVNPLDLKEFKFIKNSAKIEIKFCFLSINKYPRFERIHSKFPCVKFYSLKRVNLSFKSNGVKWKYIEQGSKL